MLNFAEPPDQAKVTMYLFFNKNLCDIYTTLKLF